MAGRIANDNPRGDSGNRPAAALHLNGNYGRWNLILQAIRYDFDVHNDPNLDASPDGSFVVMGAYDGSYHVASEATIYSAGLAYTIPVDWKPVESITFYHDFSIMIKDERDYRNTVQNVIGCAIDAGLLFIYINLASGRNQPWLGGDWTDGFADGGDDGGWHTRFNVNIGFYF